MIELKQLVRNSAVVSSDLQGDLLIYDPVMKNVQVLNPAGKAIWNMMEGGSPAFEVKESILAHAGGEHAEVLGDFFSKLETNGLLVPGGDAGKEPGAGFELPAGYEFAAPAVETYSEEFLREHLKDQSFATFHDDTYSDIAN